MIGRLSTGNSRLDEILGGGLIANAITLIAGAPGTGKTILAQQVVFNSASIERPCVYFSTVSEPFDKILRYGAALDCFDPGQVGKSVFFDDLGQTLCDDGLVGVLARVDAVLKARKPGLIVIDSFRALRVFADDDAAFRRFLHDLAGRFSAIAMSAVWVAEYDADEAVSAPAFAVADTVMSLDMKQTAERAIRYLTVRKHRGSDFQSGDHLYRITAAGLKVFPRLADSGENSAYDGLEARVSSGIAALDEALEDGYWPGSTTLIAGPSGAGKTLMGLHFLYAGAARDEPGVLVTLQENRTQLRRIADRFGWSIDDPNITILDRSPVDMYMDELVYELLDAVDAVGARRVVIDSLNDLMAASQDATRLREFLYSLVQRCARLGVSVMFTYETAELFRITRLSELGMSHIADNVVLLQHIRDRTFMKRALSVIKTRGSTNSNAVREFVITSDGIKLGEPLDLQRLGVSS